MAYARPSHAYRGIACGAAVAVALAVSIAPTPVFADTTSADLQAQLDKAQQKLQELSTNAEVAQSKLDEVQTNLDQTKKDIADNKTQIDKKTEELGSAQTVLGQQMSETYKEGSDSVLGVFLNAENFSDFFSNIYYANKVSDQKKQNIDKVQKLRGELQARESKLKSDEAKQEQLVSDQKTKTAEAKASVASAQNYYNSLSDQVKAKLEEERKAREAQAAQLAAQAQAQAEQAAAQSNAQAGNASSNGGNAAASGNGGTNANGNANGGNAASNGNNGNASTGSNTGSNNTGNATTSRPAARPSTNTNSGNAPSGVIGYAVSQLGLPYVWGASQPGVAFDCSGLTSWAYSKVGVSIPHSSRGQYSLVQSKGHLVSSVSALKPGDLVFYARGGTVYHVALYMGNGQVVHANGYGSGVVITSVTLDSGFCGGGSPV